MNISCSTCLEIFTSKCNISTIPCGHVFHNKCIEKWLTENNNCSQCRSNVTFDQIIKLYFTESETNQITEMEETHLKLEKEVIDAEKVNLES